MLKDSGSESTEELSGSEEGMTWIQWYCGLAGNEFLCQVDDDFIQDDFNLSGLASQVPYYDSALDVILDGESANMEMLNDEQGEIIEKAAEMLYGVIHARFIITAKGLNAMADKFRRVDFGRCQRVMCNGQPQLPVGTSDIPGQSTVKLFCPKCEEIYYTKSRSTSLQLDGAYFGTTFPHLLLMTYPTLRPIRSTDKYIPKIFGFKIHHTAYLTDAERQLFEQQQQRQQEEKQQQQPQKPSLNQQDSQPHSPSGDVRGSPQAQQTLGGQPSQGPRSPQGNGNQIQQNEEVGGTQFNNEINNFTKQFKFVSGQQQTFSVGGNTQIQPSFISQNSLPPNTEEAVET